MHSNDPIRPSWAAGACLFMLVLAGTCARTGGDNAGAPPDALTAAAAIERQSHRLSEAYVQGDVDGVVSVYAEDGVAIPGGGRFVRGHAALQDLWRLPEGRTILRHAARPVNITVDGDHAYDWGTYEGQAAQDGVPLDPFGGNYTIVWKRDDEGTWRIAIDMWNRSSR